MPMGRLAINRINNIKCFGSGRSDSISGFFKSRNFRTPLAAQYFTGTWRADSMTSIGIVWFSSTHLTRRSILLNRLRPSSVAVNGDPLDHRSILRDNLGDDRFAVFFLDLAKFQVRIAIPSDEVPDHVFDIGNGKVLPKRLHLPGPMP